MIDKRLLFPTLLALSLAITGCTNTSFNQSNTTEPITIRVGYFANLTHTQALVGLAQGTFQNEFENEATIKTSEFNAGPQEIEALFAGQIDIGYVGPSPAVNGYTKSDGEALQIVSGANANGVAIVLQPGLAKAFKEQGPTALAGKKIASPQQGNTQDVALRSYLAHNNLTDKVEIIPIANADQLTLFSQKELDGSWAPEPWASRLVQEAGGVIAFEESSLWPNKKFATTVIVVRKEFLDQHPDLVKKWLKAHAETTTWINEHPTEAKQLVNTEIERLTGKALNDDVLTQAWDRMEITTDPLKDSILTSSRNAYTLGFLGEPEPDLTNLFDLKLLDEVTTQ